MPQFELNGAYGPAWKELDSFTQGYVEALFFTEEAPHTTIEEWQAIEAAQGEHPEGSFPSECGFADLSPKALARIVADCQAFQAAQAALLDEAYATDAYEAEQAGRDFWFTRNHHGVGYWDRDALEANKVGDRLTKAAHAWGEVWTYLGDDSQIHLG